MSQADGVIAMTGLESLFQRYRYLLFFDTETTGLHPEENDRITELAMVRIGPEELQTEDVFIQLPVGMTIPEQIKELTGISEKMCAEGLTEAEAAELFLSQVPPSTLVIAYNAQFDLRFIARMCIRQGKTLHADYLDPMTIFKDRRPYPHRLENAIEAYCLTDRVQNTHRAIDDVLALVEVTKAMALERDDLADYVNLFGYHPKYGVSGPRLKGIRYHEQPFRDTVCPPEETLPELVKPSRLL